MFILLCVELWLKVIRATIVRLSTNNKGTPKTRAIGEMHKVDKPCEMLETQFPLSGG